MAEVTFYRSSGWAWGGRKFVVEVDGVAVGKLARKDRLTVEVPPGPHTLRARIAKFESQSLPVQLSGTDSVNVAVRPVMPDKKDPQRARQALLLVPTEAFDDRGPTLLDAKRKPGKAGRRGRGGDQGASG